MIRVFYLCVLRFYTRVSRGDDTQLKASEAIAWPEAGSFGRRKKEQQKKKLTAAFAAIFFFFFIFAPCGWGDKIPG